MKVNEMFESLQGEGRFVGYPVMFIRMSGCNRSCVFCDTSYHNEGEELSVEQMVKKIDKSNMNIIIFTGGEPMMQFDDIIKVIEQTKDKQYHIETNGDLLVPESYFDYVCFSPKSEEGLNKALGYPGICDIKVVTDLNLNKNMLESATMIMPLTTISDIKNLKIKQQVWKYCEKHNKRYAPRLHVDVWGMSKRGV